MRNDSEPHGAEIDELERIFIAEDPRGRCLRYWRRKVVHAFWALNLAFIVCVAIYLLAVYGWRFLQWLELGRP